MYVRTSTQAEDREKNLFPLPSARMSTTQVPTSAQRTMWEFSERGHKGSGSSVTTRSKFNTKDYCNQLISLSSGATLSMQTFLPLLLDKQDWEQAATACQELSSTSNTSTAAISRDISPTLGLMKMEIWWREPQRTSSSHAAKSWSLIQFPSPMPRSPQNWEHHQRKYCNQDWSNKSITSKIVSFQCVGN